MHITSDIRYVGVNDYEVDLFEGMYKVPDGMSYNSYVILDEKIAIMDTVDEHFSKDWLENIKSVLGARKPSYLITHHMEPDHSANIVKLLEIYPELTVVASAAAFKMMNNYFGTDFGQNRMIVDDGDELSLGKHKLVFVSAPMVHWPEVIMTYDMVDKVLFSADAFGKFGANDIKDDWVNEARRYYIGIVGKYGLFVQKLLDKLGKYEIKKICPLHGRVIDDNIHYYVNLYKTWATYVAEEEGVVIAYTSVYGNTRKAVIRLKDKLEENGYTNIVVHDLARCDISQAVADAFKYSRLVLATTTYNAEMFPFMRTFINYLTERKYCNRWVAFIENGGWAPIAAKLMYEQLSACKNITFAANTVRMVSTLNKENERQIELLVEEIISEIK